jgi:hypothetical protein
MSENKKKIFQRGKTGRPGEKEKNVDECLPATGFLKTTFLCMYNK